jgi:hypothetical protein
MLRLLRGGVMADRQPPPLEFEVVNEEFVLTPTLCQLLLKLARRHLEFEARQTDAGADRGGHAA